MPQQVEQAHRDAAIHDLGAQPLAGCGVRPVLPRAREHGHLVAGVRGCISADNFVHVLANAGARAQRRTVVDENLHSPMR